MKIIRVDSTANGSHDIMIDDQDYDFISQYKWFIYRCTFKGKKARTMYAVSRINGKTIRMHRLILGHNDPKTLVDHKDHNGLNNQRSNLRTATPQQNLFNCRPFKSNKTGFKGVSFHKGDKKYMVFLRVNGRNSYFGSYDSPSDAAKKWNELARQYHGEFAYQNPV